MTHSCGAPWLGGRPLKVSSACDLAFAGVPTCRVVAAAGRHVEAA
eukprot:CAMPEP_0119377896 /NCGR_PEP_ID=MMETSP1334-20130426/47187_1 /TAXON_ID=127549 /ORGANISM="Calcidiscus leptoporus, Strain RCC1130" /LENGTH=44 /DNA_ID= /DNA_START= /DNA_END= /DNA_ORIENTATION=